MTTVWPEKSSRRFVFAKTKRSALACQVDSSSAIALSRSLTTVLLGRCRLDWCWRACFFEAEAGHDFFLPCQTYKRCCCCCCCCSSERKVSRLDFRAWLSSKISVGMSSCQFGMKLKYSNRTDRSFLSLSVHCYPTKLWKRLLCLCCQNEKMQRDDRSRKFKIFDLLCVLALTLAPSHCLLCLSLAEVVLITRDSADAQRQP